MSCSDTIAIERCVQYSDRRPININRSIQGKERERSRGQEVTRSGGGRGRYGGRAVAVCLRGRCRLGTRGRHAQKPEFSDWFVYGIILPGSLENNNNNVLHTYNLRLLTLHAPFSTWDIDMDNMGTWSVISTCFDIDIDVDTVLRRGAPQATLTLTCMLHLDPRGACRKRRTVCITYQQQNVNVEVLNTGGKVNARTG